jgi:hypothetical protein
VPFLTTADVIAAIRMAALGRDAQAPLELLGESGGGMKAALFFSLLFTAVAMAGAFAHVFEMAHKMELKADDYLIVQQIYRGWSLLGIPIFGALFSTLGLTVMARRDSRLFPLSLIAFLCIMGAQAIFWLFTYPVNQETRNWTILPESWIQLRKQWEYSHAAGAALNFIAFLTLLGAALTRRP